MAASATSALLSAFEDCLRHRKGMSEHTARAYVGDIEKLAAFVAREAGDAGGDAATDDVLTGVTLEDLRAWLAAMALEGKSRTTLARRGASARSFFAWAHDEGHLPSNPAVRLASARPAHTLPEVLSVPDVFAMLRIAQMRADDGDPNGLGRGVGGGVAGAVVSAPRCSQPSNPRLAAANIRTRDLMLRRAGLF